jgi:hypothetical protein
VRSIRPRCETASAVTASSADPLTRCQGQEYPPSITMSEPVM